MPIQIKAHATDSGTSIHHFWSVCVGAGRANEGLRAGWRDQLRLVKRECGFQYVRFHGLFHDDMFVYREDEMTGDAVYNWQYVDDLFDALLEIGVRPFVELGFCPSDLATKTATVFWWKGNGSPPNDYAAWAELVRRAVQHWVERYGLDEVRSWYFEVWNEPNLWPFFQGTKSQYFELYRVTSQAVKSVDDDLRVGGPATSNFVPDARFAGETEDFACHDTVISANDLDSLAWKPVWVEQFLKWCRVEQLVVDFVSCHPYPTDWALDALGETRKLTRGVDATQTDLRTLRLMVDSSPFPNAEIHLTEWSSSPSPRDFTHDFLQAATFIVKTNIECVGLADSMAYWTFTDVFEEGGAGDTVFHGGFGMVNYQGIVKPSFHAYRFLNLLGDEIIDKTDGAVVTRHAQTGKLVALAYHYPTEEPRSAPASFDTRDVAERTLILGRLVSLTIELSGLPPDAEFVIETLDREHGNAMAAWQKMGSPEPPTREQTAELKSGALAVKTELVHADANGHFLLERMIEPWSVVLVRQV